MVGRLWRRVCRKDNFRGKDARIDARLNASFRVVYACHVQEEGRTRPFILSVQLRLSRIFRRAEPRADPDAVPLGRVVLWGLFGVALVVGLVLYFKYERLVAPLLT